jgi:hypothetical protein
LFAPFVLIALLSGATVHAQSPSHFAVESTIAVDTLRGDNAVHRPNIVVDLTGTLRLGDGWLVYVRPWFRQPRADDWDREIYQAALQYERSGAVATRVDVGYIASPSGLGIMDSRPADNPTILPHLAYFTPMPAFDAGAHAQQLGSSTRRLTRLEPSMVVEAITSEFQRE